MICWAVSLPLALGGAHLLEHEAIALDRRIVPEVALVALE
jgi:hypothetical protein